MDVADLIIEEEAQRMLEKISQQIQAIGLSVDQYLKAQGKTEEDLKKDYEKVAEKNIKAEFVLAQLVMDEKVEVTEEEITEIMSAAGVEGVQKMIEDPNERFYVKTILQKNKVLAKLIEEAEGEHHHEHK